MNTQIVLGEVAETIAETLNASKAQLSVKQAALLSIELQPVIQSVVAKIFQRVLETVAAVDPVSGLPVPAAAREPYQYRADSHRKLSSPEFLAAVWGDYQEAGLLYTGHIRKLDDPLYQSLIYHAKTALSQTGNATDKRMAEYILTKYRMLSAYHLKHPELVPDDFKRQAEIISQTVVRRAGAAEIRFESALNAVAQSAR